MPCQSSSNHLRKYFKEDNKLPTVEEHKKKYRENKDVLNHELNIDNCKCYDWIATVAFYSAVHLVEGKLAESGVHTDNHTNRKRAVERFGIFRNIRNQYKALYDRSRIARYEACCLNEKKARQSLEFLSDIEKEIQI